MLSQLRRIRGYLFASDTSEMYSTIYCTVAGKQPWMFAYHKAEKHEGHRQFPHHLRLPQSRNEGVGHARGVAAREVEEAGARAVEHALAALAGCHVLAHESDHNEAYIGTGKRDEEQYFSISSTSSVLVFFAYRYTSGLLHSNQNSYMTTYVP